MLVCWLWQGIRAFDLGCAANGIYWGRFLRWSTVSEEWLKESWDSFLWWEQYWKTVRCVGSKTKNLHALLYWCHSSVENEMYLCMFLHALYLDLWFTWTCRSVEVDFFIFFKVWLLFVFYCLIGFLSVAGSVCMHVLIFAYLHVHVLS